MGTSEETESGNPSTDRGEPGTLKPLQIQGLEESQGLARTNGAERAGFEPAEGFYPLAALAKRCFRPLSHLSKVFIF
jgi:hypothetical protein